MSCNSHKGQVYISIFAHGFMLNDLACDVVIFKAEKCRNLPL